MGPLPRDWNPDSAQYKNTLETLPCVGQHALFLANFEKRSETPATSGQLRTDRDQGRLMFLVLLHQTLTVGRLCSLTLSMSIEYGTQRRAYPQPKLVCTDHVTIPSFLSPEAIPLERSNFLSLGREFVSYFQPIRFVSFVRFALGMRRVTDSPWIKDFWCCTFPEVLILGADLKDQSLWGWKCQTLYLPTFLSYRHEIFILERWPKHIWRHTKTCEHV